MNRQQLVNAILAVIVIAALAIAGVVGYYYFFQPDKTQTLSKENSDKMWALLKEANYVSPDYPKTGDANRAIYVVSNKGCKECRDYEALEFPKFKAAGIETRVYTFTPSAGQGAADNATIVDIWLTRDWNLYQTWVKDPLWKADGAPQNPDMARRYVLKATQDFYSQVRALIPAKTPSDVHPPMVMWATKDNLIKVCFCDNDRTYHNVTDDFGLSTAGVTLPTINLPESFGGSASSSSSASAKPAASASSSSDGQPSTDFGPDT
jgi:hypothetical protein